LGIQILSQPDDSTCGPTSLHGVYRYYDLDISLDEVIRQVTSWKTGGTLAVNLGIHALRMGFQAAIYTYNLKVFDPTWKGLSNNELIGKLRDQRKWKRSKRFLGATQSYIDFLSQGGEIRFQEMDPPLLYFFLDRKYPILTGLSATYLYDCARERTNFKGKSVFDDLKGAPMGHFVILHQRDGEDQIHVADPYKENPMVGAQYYTASVQKIMNSILLGILTYDANLLIIHPLEIPCTGF